MTNITPMFKFAIGYYDGPIDGVCEMHGQLCYFDSEDVYHNFNKCDTCDEEDDESCICYIERVYTTHHISYLPLLRLRFQHSLFRFLVHDWGSKAGYHIWYNWFNKSRLKLRTQDLNKIKLSKIDGFNYKKTIRR